MNKKILVILVIVFSLCTSCLELLDNAAKAASENSSESLSAENYRTIVADSLFSLNVPNYMKEIPNLNPDATLEYGNIYKEAYTAVIVEDKAEFLSVFKDINEYNDELTVIQNYAYVQKNMFKETIENFKYQDYGLTKINDLPARQVKIYGQFEGIDASYLIGFIEGPSNIYMIMNWTVDDRMDRLENTFEYINGTFKLLK